MKYLVLGSSGMAGHMISIYLHEQGHEVIGISRTKNHYINSISLDVTNTEDLKNIIEAGNFEIIINAIGILNDFAEENKANAVFINSFLPHFLSDLTKNQKTKIIHISTDCVFSGLSGNYTEASFPDGQSFYARTKAMGELNDSKNITLRTSIIGPDLNPKGIGLFNWFMNQKSSVDGYINVIWTGITTLELAMIINQISQSPNVGLFNMVNNTKISKYQLLMLFNYYFKNNEISIVKNYNLKVDKSLLRTRFNFNYTVNPYEDMLQKLSIWMKNHRQLYPHYNLEGE